VDVPQATGWSALGPIGGFGAASIAGFDPVGQVFGTTVAYLGHVGNIRFNRCFVSSSAKQADRTTAVPHNPLLAALVAARKLVLDRAVEKCGALGGDGIIGMRMRAEDFFTDTVKFSVEGTAVRARSLTRPATPFTTHVDGQDLARLLRSGWMPVALVFGVAIAACHFDDSMFDQTARGIGAVGNREVHGYTRLVNDARHEARGALERAVRDRGGQGAVVHEMTLRFEERPCPLQEQHSDYVVEAMVLGSAIVSFERAEPTTRQTPLTIMRLDRRTADRLDEPVPTPGASARPTRSDRAFAYWTARRQAQATDPADGDGNGDGDGGGAP
jgi:uncharacterized protein YbjQ (UPF0145 family)